MTLASYATTADLKTRLGITANTQDTVLADLLECASRSIDIDANRYFGKDTTATVRLVDGNGKQTILVPDISTLTALVVTLDDVTLVKGTDFFVSPDAISDAPAYMLTRQNGSLWTVGNRNVSVTAMWGWPAVPSVIRMACLYRAEQLYHAMGKPDFAGETIGDYTYRRWTPEQVQRQNMLQVGQFRRGVCG